MKITAFERDGCLTIGAVEDAGRVRTLAEASAFWRDPAVGIAAAGGEIVTLSPDARERPAVPRDARVICVGLNYRSHAEETGAVIPDVPVIFARWAATLSVDGEPAPLFDESFDYEVELGVVIGRPMFRVPAEQAMRSVFGYAAFNDLSARGFQRQTLQWTMGKNGDASGPISPIVIADEVGDPREGLRLTTHVNGVKRQDGTTADMIFPVAEIIAHVSQVMTLRPGDLIVTGTPAGVAAATGDFLKVGDEVVVEVERVGRVATPIVAAPAPRF